MYDFVRYFDRIAPECKVRSYGTPQASYRASVNGVHRGFGDSGNKRGVTRRNAQPETDGGVNLSVCHTLLGGSTDCLRDGIKNTSAMAGFATAG